jgi:hypothetical protein
MKRKRLKNLLRQLLVIEMSLPASKRSLYIGNREISRNLTDQEFNSPEIQQAIGKKLVKPVKGLVVSAAPEPAPKAEPKAEPKAKPKAKAKAKPKAKSEVKSEATIVSTPVEESADKAPDVDNQDRGV